MEKLDLDFYYGKESEQFIFYRLPKALITNERFKGITNNAKPSGRINEMKGSCSFKKVITPLNGKVSRCGKWEMVQ